MGHVVHHAIVVSSWDETAIEKAHTAASDYGNHVTSIAEGAVNGERSFLVVPDGSKSGWETSAIGDAARESFIVWMGEQAYDDGSNNLRWVEVEFGDDNHTVKARVVDDSNRQEMRHPYNKPEMVEVWHVPSEGCPLNRFPVPRERLEYTGPREEVEESFDEIYGENIKQFGCKYEIRPAKEN